jgi:hypothetical protein
VVITSYAKPTEKRTSTSIGDVLDKELGRVDVKAAKRKFRQGPVDYTIWWELRTVKRPPENKPAKGWGVPNGINRFIAVRSEDKFILIDPSNIYEDLQKRCVEYYRGEFGLHTRPGRGDLMTILPLEYVIKNATMEIRDMINGEDEYWNLAHALKQLCPRRKL